MTIEREQQTYQMLATCGLRPAHIIWGKLMAAVAFVALLLTSSLPLVSLSFLLGGVSPGEVFGTYVSLALSAFVFGSIGILCSASLRATAAATVATYAAVILLFFLTLIFGTAAPDEMPFRSVNAATAIFHSVDMEPFFTTHLPSWLIGVTLNLLMGLLFANMAMTKLEYFDDRRPFRGARAFHGALAAFLLFLTGDLYGLGGASWSSLATKVAHELNNRAPRFLLRTPHRRAADLHDGRVAGAERRTGSRDRRKTGPNSGRPLPSLHAAGRDAAG